MRTTFPRRPAAVSGCELSHPSIDRDRMIDLQLLRRSANVIEVFLERELRRVDADHHQSLIFIFRGPRPDIGERAQPINAGIGPDIDEDDFSAQAGWRQWLRVEPSGRAAE